MRLLDLFCGAGGASMGYHNAGFEVVGVDLAPQPRYPFEFHQADALQYLAEHGREFDAIHASPPCQFFSTMRRGLWQEREHPNLIPPTRDLLRAIGKPYTIENVEGARAELVNPIRLCGTMFGLGTKDGSQLRRHRYFELSIGWFMTPPCRHGPKPAGNRPRTIGVWGHAGGSSVRDGIVQFSTDERREAMGIDWMTGAELSEAIPPAYTEYIGKHILEVMNEKVN